jgi:hypothetical protein
MLSGDNDDLCIAGYACTDVHTRNLMHEELHGRRTAVSPGNDLALTKSLPSISNPPITIFR